MNRASFSERFRYWFDRVMSSGTIPLIGWLFFVLAFVVFIITVVSWAIGTDPQDSFAEQIWKTAMFVLKTGALANSPSSFGLGTVTLVLTSIFVLSTLIGVITTGIQSKLAQLQRGTSRVLETGHSVILGWTPRVFPIIFELLEANKNQQKATIVILGDRDKVEMEKEIRSRVGHQTGRTRIICRRGNPMDRKDLEIASLSTSKSIIILGPLDDNHDSIVIKVLLAIIRNPSRCSSPYNIVTAIHDPRNIEVARSIGPREIEIIPALDLVSHIIAHSCRQAGVSLVYVELLDFGGDEIYMQVEPSVVERTYEDTLLAYEDSAVIGIRTREGISKLNPDAGTVIHEGDQIIAISEDDDTVRISGIVHPPVEEETIAVAVPHESKAEHTLMFGWSRYAIPIIKALDDRVCQGSSVTIVTNFGEDESKITSLSRELSNQTCTLKQGDISSRATLESLAYINIDHVIVIPDSDTLSSQEADARTMITLLHLRDIARLQEFSFSLVTEFLDGRNAALVQAERADDFVVSDRLVGLMITQVSENKNLFAVLQELYRSEGSEIHMKPATDYVKLGRPVNFYSIVKAAMRRGETAIGYKILADANNASKSYGVVLNPVKSRKQSFSEQDKVIVLAES